MRRITHGDAGLMALLFLFGSSTVAIAEDITLTTYYPAPRGVYEEIRTTNNTYLASVAGALVVGTSLDPRGTTNGRLIVAGPGQPPDGTGNCPAGTAWYDENNSGTIDGTECHPTGLYVDSSFNVGIGTTSPLDKLHVIASGGFTVPENPDGTSTTGNVPLVAQSDSTAIGILNGAGREAFALNIDFPAGVASTPASRGIPTFYDKFDGGWHSSISLKNGNVGIGTTTPGYRLDVADRMRVRQGGSGTAGIWFYETAPAADRAFVGMADDTHVGFWGNTGASWGLTMDTSSGNVGIGTTSPGAKLEVQGGNIRVEASAGAVTDRTTLGRGSTVLSAEYSDAPLVPSLVPSSNIVIGRGTPPPFGFFDPFITFVAVDGRVSPAVSHTTTIAADGITTTGDLTVTGDACVGKHVTVSEVYRRAGTAPDSCGSCDAGDHLVISAVDVDNGGKCTKVCKHDSSVCSP